MMAKDALPNRIFAACKRALKQFLALPLIVVVSFVALSLVIYAADDAWSRGQVPHGFAWLGKLLGDSKALNTLLSTIASSIITVTSITFSLLLIALQQGAAALTTQVTDQFLRRKTNQFFFGFFVGLSVYVLLTLITASDIHRPVFGTSVALVLTIAALCMIVVMIYSTIDQMRPSQIVRAIHQHVLTARRHEMEILAKTRRSGEAGWPIALRLNSPETGNFADLQVETLDAALKDAFGSDAQIEMVARLGLYLALNDPVAVVRMRPGVTPDITIETVIAERLLGAVAIDNDRDLGGDPSYGLSQLSTIAWTSISTAKSNPSPGRAVIDALRDILARWGDEFSHVKEDRQSAVIYADQTPFEAIDVLETIMVVSSESIQAQTLADAYRTIAILLTTAPDPMAERLTDVIRRSLSALGEHVLTRDLDMSLDRIVAALESRGFHRDAAAVMDARAAFARSLGILNSRSTRVPST